MKPLQRWLGLGLCVLAIISSGCNIPALAYFLGSPNPSVDPSLKRLATDDKDTKVKIAIIAASNLQLNDQLSRVDRELAALTTKRLKELCAKNGDNVVILPVNKIEHYKTEHPRWNEGIDLVSIGKDLGVRYVIYLEINSMSLYMRGSKELYQGETDIKVSLVNVRRPDDPPEVELTHEQYPESPRSVFDTPNPAQFRNEFLDRVATKIAWKFTKHSPEDEYNAR